MKLQARLIQRIEEDDFSGIAHAVYLRGYLTSYARLLDMPQILAEKVIAERGVQAPLVSTGRVSRSRYLMDRYSVSATYLILTALVNRAGVWLATHGGLEQNLAARSCDSPLPTREVAIPNLRMQENPMRHRQLRVAADGTPPQISDECVALAVLWADSPTPIIASMAPFTALASRWSRARSRPLLCRNKRTTSLEPQAQQSRLVEVVDANGVKIEYGLLGAGVERNYTSDTALTIRIGNAEGAEVIADGSRVDLAPFQRANVARLRLFGGEKLASRIDS